MKNTSFISKSALALIAGCSLISLTATAEEWPVVKHFDSEHTLRVALPMGGIGCGAISLSGRGELVDWEIMNRPNKTMSELERQADSRTFFAIRVKGKAHESVTMLAGPLHPTELYADEGNSVPQAGLPRFRNATFDGAFPFGTVHSSVSPSNNSLMFSLSSAACEASNFTSNGKP